MRRLPSTRFKVYTGILLLGVILSLCAGCTNTGSVNNGKTMPEKPVQDPVVGTWNGFSAMSAEKVPISDSAIIGEVARIRLNIYPDLTFEYTTNFSIQDGILTPTGKGNYIIKSNETETEKKYFRYDEDQDILKWESRDMSIEFRRNDQSFSPSDLVEYNKRLLELFVEDQQAVMTPVPTQALAHIYSEGFGYDPTANIIYQTNGKIEIETGVYRSVGVIVRYPGRDTYEADVGGMGGGNYTRKDFKIVIDDRVKNQTPEFFVRLDDKNFPTIITGNMTGNTIYTAFSHSE